MTNACFASSSVSAKLHYTDTGYGQVVQHHQRTSSQQFYNLLYNKFATSQCQSPTSRHVKMLGCGKLLSVGGEFVVQQVLELLWARPLVMLYNVSVVACSHVLEFGTNALRDAVVYFPRNFVHVRARKDWKPTRILYIPGHTTDGIFAQSCCHGVSLTICLGADFSGAMDKNALR